MVCKWLIGAISGSLVCVTGAKLIAEMPAILTCRGADGSYAVAETFSPVTVSIWAPSPNASALVPMLQAEVRISLELLAILPDRK
jgi:hypothetical protein